MEINSIRRLDLDFDTFYKFCNKILEDIMEYAEGYGFPETACVLQRGGSVPVRYITDAMGIHEVYSMGVRSYTGVGESTKVEIYQDIPKWVPKKFPPKRVKWKNLVVSDDVFDSGATSKFVDNHLKSRYKFFKGRHIFVAPMIKPSAKELLKYMEREGRIFYAEECPSDEWVVFPFEAFETIRELHKSSTDPENDNRRRTHFEKLIADNFTEDEIEMAFKCIEEEKETKQTGFSFFKRLFSF